MMSLYIKPMIKRVRVIFFIQQVQFATAFCTPMADALVHA